MGSICASRLEYFDMMLVRMLKRILTSKRTHPTSKSLTSEFEELRWLTTSERRDESMLKFLYKHVISWSWLAESAKEMLKFRPLNTSGREVRKPRNLMVPTIRTAFGPRGFGYRATLRWNQLPAILQNQTNYPDFCVELRKFIIESRPANFLHKYL